MKKKEEKKFLVPLDVPKSAAAAYLGHLKLITKNTGRLMLFAGDQRVEHLNDDFYGAKNIAPEDADPEHLFRIAARARIGAFATQLGYINKYGRDYPHIPYIVKLNSKSNLVKPDQADPESTSWYSIEQVMEIKKRTGMKICGIGYTIYLGSEFEHEMLTEAAQLIYEAHRYGLVAIVWVYPRGKAVPQERYGHLIAGGVNVAAALGADFVKINYPRPSSGQSSAEQFKEAILAGNRTKVICAGGGQTNPKAFLQTLVDQLEKSGAGGNATGRNVHQRPLDEAVRFCNAIAAVTFDGQSAASAYKIYLGRTK